MINCFFCLRMMRAKEQLAFVVMLFYTNDLRPRFLLSASKLCLYPDTLIINIQCIDMNEFKDSDLRMRHEQNKHFDSVKL